MLDTNI